MNSLRFGSLDHPTHGRRNRSLLAGVVGGIAHYGNAFGVATVGGEVAFDDAYSLNPLVNAFALGVVKRDQIFFGKATGIGNPILYVGAKTGRDGIHGATMASAEFDDAALAKRPTVQVGDPFLEKLLLEACLEAMRSGAVAGIQDMGAAGLTSSTCEMASRAGTGVEIDLSLVPQREQGMTAYEMLLSESQERMLIVAHSGREREVVDIFRKWDLDAVVIGRVREGHNMHVVHEAETVADIPVSALTDEAPLYERPMTKPSPKSKVQSPKSEDQRSKNQRQNHNDLAGSAGILPADASVAPKMSGHDQAAFSHDATVTTADRMSALPANDALLKLLASPNLASKQFVYRQYDHMVRTNTAVLPGADAAVVRIKETRRALAMSLDGNGRYCAANPREGAKLIVAEAARNVVCVGARPLAVTNCLNFASPERPEVMWSFSEVVDGMAEACRALNTPVVSGNVSFYNETEGRGILPTPVIGMIGLVEDVRRVVQPGFKQAGDVIALLGTTADDLSISEYAATVSGRSTDEMIANGSVPKLELEAECAVQNVCLAAAEAGLLASAHDCSDGGLAVALAECCFASLNRAAIGADVTLPESLRGSLPAASMLFSESPSRIIVSFPASSRAAIEQIAERENCLFTVVGHVGGDTLEIKFGDEEGIAVKVSEIESVWRGALSKKLEAEVMAAGME
jgi:phosphoribosylformylglycinamidine synthase